jgi:hypothetical protein
MAIKKRKYLWLLLLIPLFSHLLQGNAEGCAACEAAGKLANESENKAFYALRILYERKGRAALPFIRRGLKLDNNPPTQMRAAAYIAELNDTESIPQLEKILSQLVKRVSFSTFGLKTTDFRRRWIVAYTLGTLGAPGMADRIWARYDRFTLSKKMEVPSILAALADPKLTEHLMGILGRCEDHQLMIVTLDTMATGGNAQSLPFLRSKIVEWEAKAAENSGSVNIDTQVDYFVLSRKAAQIIPKIEERLTPEGTAPAIRKDPQPGKAKAQQELVDP